MPPTSTKRTEKQQGFGSQTPIFSGMMNQMPLRFSLQNRDLAPQHQPIVQEIGEELLICDPLSGTVHLLPTHVALVYQACDGKTPTDQVAARFGADGEQVLAQCLSQLQQANLIALPAEDNPSRRQFLAGAGALSAALITSISLPHPVSASSACITTGNTGCNSASQPAVDGANRPLGCGGTACCGAFCPGSCPCAGCQCMAQYRCRDAGGTVVVCSSSTAGDICVPGSNDTLVQRICMQPDTVNVALSCAAAKALAGSLRTLYACCSCP
jgi:hypothetical protein